MNDDLIKIEFPRRYWINLVKILKNPPNVWSKGGIPFQIENQIKEHDEKQTRNH